MLFHIAEIVGSTVADLYDNITQSEFNGWVTYLNTKPPDTQEIQMAILINLVAQGLGAKESKIENYIINKTKQQEKGSNENVVMSSDEVSAVFGALAIPLE